MEHPLSRPALGCVAALGDLYDARTDTFCGISLFKREIPENALTMADNHFSDIHLLHSDTFSEKCAKLDVEAQLQVSVLAGLFSLEGSGRYLSDQKTSERTVKSSLIYNIKTKEDFVNIYHEDLKGAFTLEPIELGIATHVVVGRLWGANSVLSCEYKNNDNRDVKEIEGSLSAQLNKMSLSISGKASVKFLESDNGTDVSFDIRIFGDILPQNQDLPTTFEDALELMKQMPNLVMNANEGRGKPLSYKLIPLSLLKDYLNFSFKVDSLLTSIEDECLIRIVQLFDSMSQAQQKVYDFSQDVIDYKVCVTQSDINLVTSFKNQLASEEAKFRSSLATTLSSVRSGQDDVSKLEDLLAQSSSDGFSPSNVDAQLSEWGHIKAKINFAKSLVSSGATYVGNGVSLDELISNNFETKIFILFFQENAKTSDKQTWKANRQIFLQEMKKSKDNKYLAVDCDIHSDLWPDSGLSIHVVQNGQVLTDNLLAGQQQTEIIPFAKCTGPMERLVTRPNKMAPLTIVCTGQNCKPDTKYEWVCRKCKSLLEYGFDEFIYCACGKGAATLFEFKCTDPDHGVAYERHDEEYLKSILERIRVFKEMNILILGETGVGKSTWINGFVNYISFTNLSDAESSDPITLIPSEFTVCDEEYNEITVSTGTDSNESQTAGQSATQQCKVYPFPIGDKIIRLIDTPGIGDTRGVDQDRLNFQNILDTLSYLDELHGICILLKPNNARLTVMFRFCIKELLSYLHKDACQNIMFCFTNTRGTFYRPGDTMPALKSLLKENEDVEIVISSKTIYCFDSESYRFLAASKNPNDPVKFSDKERENFADSWEMSCTETKRLLEHIATLVPHCIKSTLNLNHSREVVLNLTKPMADISKVIYRLKEVIHDERIAIEVSDEDAIQLEKEVNLSRPSVKITPLAFPRTVCTNSDCVEYSTDSLGKKVAKYTKICHDQCSLGQSVTRDTIGDVNLLNCLAMTGSDCNVCGHSYLEHLHTYCATEDIIVQYEDPAIKSLLQQKLSAKETKEKLIDLKNEELQELQEESDIIDQASIKFTCFLKHNSIMPYNDAKIEYMDHLIRQEEGKVAQGGSGITLEALKSSQAAYKEQVEILSDNIERSGSESITLADIHSLVDQLKKLKHSGENLEKSLTAVINAGKSHAVYQEVVIPKEVSQSFWEKAKGGLKWLQNLGK